MIITQLLPAAASIVVLVFATLVFRRYTHRGGTHLLVWGLGLTMFGVVAFGEAYLAMQGWHPVVFRLWYLSGAVLTAAWLGQGTIFLLSGQRLPNLLVSLVFGVGGASVASIALAGALGISRGPMSLFIILGVLVVAVGCACARVLQRRWIRHWDPQKLAVALTVLLSVGSLIATYLIFTVPLNGTRFDRRRTLSAQYQQILPQRAAVRKITPIFNSYGTLTLVGGALYSAWLLWRKEIVPNRVLGNICIAIGGLSLGFASTLVRLGLGDYLYPAELAAAIAMFGGFLLATTRVPMARRVPGEVGS